MFCKPIHRSYQMLFVTHLIDKFHLPFAQEAPPDLYSKESRHDQLFYSIYLWNFRNSVHKNMLKTKISNNRWKNKTFVISFWSLLCLTFGKLGFITVLTAGIWRVRNVFKGLVIWKTKCWKRWLVFSGWALMNLMIFFIFRNISG